MSDKEFEFLRLSYKEVDFLINRKQFFASMIVNDVKSVSSACSFIHSIMPYNEQNVLLYDLDFFIQASFKNVKRIEEASHNSLAIITDIQAMSDKNKSILKKIKFKGKSLIDNGHFGFVLHIQSEIIMIPIEHLKLFPQNVRTFFNLKGILGCRFIDKRIQYVIDIDTILSNSIMENLQ